MIQALTLWEETRNTVGRRRATDLLRGHRQADRRALPGRSRCTAQLVSGVQRAGRKRPVETARSQRVPGGASLGGGGVSGAGVGVSGEGVGVSTKPVKS